MNNVLLRQTNIKLLISFFFSSMFLNTLQKEPQDPISNIVKHHLCGTTSMLVSIDLPSILFKEGLCSNILFPPSISKMLNLEGYKQEICCSTCGQVRSQMQLLMLFKGVGQLKFGLLELQRSVVLYDGS
jgi:hypothetical protein